MRKLLYSFSAALSFIKEVIYSSLVIIIKKKKKKVRWSFRKRTSLQVYNSHHSKSITSMPIIYSHVVLRAAADMIVNCHGSEKGKTPHLSTVSALQSSAQEKHRLVSGCRWRPQKWSEQWNTFAIRKGWESWGSLWIKGGSQDSLLCGLSVLKGSLSTERWGQTIAGPVPVGWGVMVLN